MADDEAAGPVHYGIALFGVGRIGSIHLTNLVANPRATLRYVVDDDTQVALAAVRRLDAADTVKVVTSDKAATVFEDPSIDAVMICTPTPTHEAIVRAALISDKAVFCEKPLAGSLAGIDELYELAKRRGLHLFCAFQRRFDPSFVDVKKAVSEGRVGTVHVVKSCSRDNPLPPIDFLRTSGGIFHDCAVHDIDIVCWMLGKWPESVVAVAHTHLASIAELDDSDTVAITMKFPSGVIAVIDLSRHGVYGYDQRVEVFGTDGMMVADNQRPTSCSISDRQGTLSAPFQYTFLQRYETAYKVELEHFLRVLAGQETMTVTSETTRMVCRVATACETSSRQQRLVKLSEFSS